MELIIDFILLAASGAAVFYCVVLSRKLEKLKDTEKGLGATIASMSQTVDQAHSTVVLAKESSNQSVAELTPLIEEVRVIVPKVTEMIDALGKLGEVARENIVTAAAGASLDIEDSLSDARAVQSEISQRIFELNELLNGENGTAPEAETAPEPLPETTSDAEPEAPPEAVPAAAEEPSGEIIYVEDITPPDSESDASSAGESELKIDLDEKAAAAG